MSLICIQDQDEYYQNGTFASVLFQRQIPIHIDPEADMAMRSSVWNILTTSQTR